MEYFLNAGILSGVFAVPNSVVDSYIKLANEAAVKVLLFILRHSGENLNRQFICSNLNLTENQVEEAFVFWENANILSKTVAVPSAEIKTENKISVSEKPKTEKKTIISDRSDYNLNPSEIAARIEKSEDIKFLFSMSEQSFARPLTHTEQRSLIWLRDYLGLCTEVILMIIAFCISNEKGNIKYIETVAADWAEREINSLELAESEIKRLEESMGYNNKIMKICNMNRKPTSKQQKIIDDWKIKGYSMELIEYAYEKTIESIDKLNFPYMNKILENWYSQGLLTRTQVDNFQKKDSSNKTKEYSFDLESYKSLVNNFGD